MRGVARGEDTPGSQRGCGNNQVGVDPWVATAPRIHPEVGSALEHSNGDRYDLASVSEIEEVINRSRDAICAKAAKDFVVGYCGKCKLSVLGQIPPSRLVDTRVSAP
jgi:hypothetical protein